ncbi:MAG: hypothetical protein LC130_08240 [Bryobacterales bacterium]|nr:hypothetical protein [Bryobacterales bacterium]
MSLKARIRTSIVALVAGIVIILSLVHLNTIAQSLFTDVLSRSEMITQQVRGFLTQRVNERTAALEHPPRNYDELKKLWTRLVADDPALHDLLQQMMAKTISIVEVSVYDSTGKVIASSDPDRLGQTAGDLPSLEEWNRKTAWSKFTDLLTSQQNYRVSVPLGFPNTQETVFTIGAIVSPVLLRYAVVPQVRDVAVLSLVAIILSMALSVAFSNVMLRPLARISAAIDRIASGESAVDVAPPGRESREFAEVQSKLDLLGQQFRGARQDAVGLRTNMQQLFERLEEAVLLFDGDLRLIMAGQPAERFLGKSRWEMSGRGIEEIFPASTLMGSTIQNAIQFNRPLKEHLFSTNSNDTSVGQVLVSVEILESFPSRKVAGALVTLADAESRSEVQSQLDVSSRLAAISRLTGGAAHEIKNPLNAITLHLEVLKTRIANEGTDAPELEVIEREIRRLDRVVKTFLDFTKPVQLNLQEVDLCQMIGEIGSLVQPEAGQKGMSVDVDPGQGNCIISGDYDLLKQAILNIVMNGLQAMAPGGVLRISLEEGEWGYSLRITDQGAGMTPEVKEKIFDLYFSTKDGGSGIGLAMTFRVVQLHGGTIDVNSESGKGSTFILRLPRRRRRVFASRGIEA